MVWVRSWCRFVALLALVVGACGATVAGGSSPEAGNGRYIVLGADGVVRDEFGVVVSEPLFDGAEPATLASTDAGFLAVAADGAVRSGGDAVVLGDLSTLALTRPIVDIAVVDGGDGYYLVGSDGGVFAFGSARFHGSLPEIVPVEQLVAPIVSIVATEGGDGYWLMAADGGVFSFGDAVFHGSVPGVVSALDAPIVAAVSALDASGYGLMGADGGVFAFGGFDFSFSAAGLGLDVVDLVAVGDHYSLLTGDSGVVVAGEAPPSTGVAAVAFDLASTSVSTAVVDPFGRVRVQPGLEVDGVGDDVDTIAFWIAPEVEDSLMFVTSKATQEVEVWRFPFDVELPSLRHPTFGDSTVNGVIVDAVRDRMYVATSSPASSLSVFTLPDLAFIEDLNAGRFDLADEPNTELYDDGDGAPKALLTADEIIHVLDTATGERLATIDIDADLETAASDEHWGRVLVPDEKDGRGIFVFTPDGQSLDAPLPNPFGGEHFDADAEGIAIRVRTGLDGTDTGRGLVIVSDQRDDMTDFEVFDRETGMHLGVINIDGVAHTDGIATLDVPLPGYPDGLFAAINDDGSVVLVGWDVISAAVGADL